MAKENGVHIHNGISYSAINKNEIILVGKKMKIIIRNYLMVRKIIFSELKHSISQDSFLRPRK